MESGEIEAGRRRGEARLFQPAQGAHLAHEERPLLPLLVSQLRAVGIIGSEGELPAEGTGGEGEDQPVPGRERREIEGGRRFLPGPHGEGEGPGFRLGLVDLDLADQDRLLDREEGDEDRSGLPGRQAAEMAVAETEVEEVGDEVAVVDLRPPSDVHRIGAPDVLDRRLHQPREGAVGGEDEARERGGEELLGQGDEVRPVHDLGREGASVERGLHPAPPPVGRPEGAGVEGEDAVVGGRGDRDLQLRLVAAPILDPEDGADVPAELRPQVVVLGPERPDRDEVEVLAEDGDEARRVRLLPGRQVVDQVDTDRTRESVVHARPQRDAHPFEVERTDAMGGGEELDQLGQGLGGEDHRAGGDDPVEIAAEAMGLGKLEEFSPGDQERALDSEEGGEEDEGERLDPRGGGRRQLVAPDQEAEG